MRDIGLLGRIILNGFLIMQHITGLTRVKWASLAGFCEHGNELSTFIKGRDLLEHLAA
jgi:hypothetical protein